MPRTFAAHRTLEVLPQIHAAVEAGYLVSVTVEHQSRLALIKERRADAPFGLLAPTGMVDVRIYIGIEAIFLGRHIIPRSGRLVRREVYLHDRFRRLETIFPRNNDPHRSAILVGQHLPVQSKG